MRTRPSQKGKLDSLKCEDKPERIVVETGTFCKKLQETNYVKTDITDSWIFKGDAATILFKSLALSK